MWPFSRLRDHRYCAFCKVLRRVYVKKHIDLTNVVVAASFSAAVTYAVWGAFDPQGLLSFCIALAFAEVFVYLRWRMTITCNLCGFDPILYKRSPVEASARVKEFFKAQVENPEFWLTKSPLLDVQKRIRAQEKKAIERQIVNRRKVAAVPVAAPGSTVVAKGKGVAVAPPGTASSASSAQVPVIR